MTKLVRDVLLCAPGRHAARVLGFVLLAGLVAHAPARAEVPLRPGLMAPYGAVRCAALRAVTENEPADSDWNANAPVSSLTTDRGTGVSPVSVTTARRTG